MEPAELKGINGAIDAIGRYLEAEAIWHYDRCTWIGSRFDPSGRTYEATLDPWLYDGSSGVALFLAELSTTRQSGNLRKTALGAIRQALHQSETESHGSGLYIGTGGVAITSVRVGRLLNDESVRERALSLAVRIEEETEGHDLLSGTAGSIVALLALNREFDELDFIERAIILGDKLLEAQPPGGIEFTGLAHGAAGVGFALAQLFAVTNQQRFRQGAIAAFEHERELFDPRMRNWPDLRSRPPGSMAAWCHGGPGIALTRLSAHALLGDDRCLEEAAIGLEVAHTALLHPGLDYSYCHGIAGNAEVVLEGARVLGGDGASIAAAAIVEGVRRHGSDASWPCGVTGRTSPGLMLGLAGIGRFLLTLTGARLPSVLRISGVAN